MSRCPHLWPRHRCLVQGMDTLRAGERIWEVQAATSIRLILIWTKTPVLIVFSATVIAFSMTMLRSLVMALTMWICQVPMILRANIHVVLMPIIVRQQHPMNAGTTMDADVGPRWAEKNLRTCKLTTKELEEKLSNILPHDQEEESSPAIRVAPVVGKFNDTKKSLLQQIGFEDSVHIPGITKSIEHTQ